LDSVKRQVESVERERWCSLDPIVFGNPLIAEDGMSASSVWMTVDQAAAFLSLPPVTLRRSLERNARATHDGGVVARVDGITARKLGRLWRVQLDATWLAGQPADERHRP